MAWATIFLCARSRRTPHSADDRAGNDLAGAACKLVVLEHRAPPIIRAARHSANLAVTCMAQTALRISRAAARVELVMVLTAMEADTSDDEVPGQSNTESPLPEGAFHHRFGGFVAMRMCDRSKPALSQSCHSALFVSCLHVRPLPVSSRPVTCISHRSMTRRQRACGAAIRSSTLQESCSHRRRCQFLAELTTSQRTGTVRYSENGGQLGTTKSPSYRSISSTIDDV